MWERTESLSSSAGKPVTSSSLGGIVITHNSFHPRPHSTTCKSMNYLLSFRFNKVILKRSVSYLSNNI